MARGKFITDFEKDVIRIGISRGIAKATIARALKRRKSAIGQQVQRMADENTLDNLPMVFVVDEIAQWIERDGALK